MFADFWKIIICSLFCGVLYTHILIVLCDLCSDAVLTFSGQRALLDQI